MAIACALAVTVVAWRKVAGYRSWPSVPHRLAWVDAKGAPLGTTFGHYDCAGDIRFQTMIDGERVWAMCSSGGDRLPNGALALLEPAQGRARVVGTFDRKVRWTTGVLPGPGGTLAIVVSTFDPEGQSVAVASPEGWKLPPAPLPGAGNMASAVGLLGMSFRGDVLEVAVLPVTAEDPFGEKASPTIVTFAPGAGPKTRTVTRGTLHCELYCRVVAAYRRTGEDGWRFLVDDMNLEHGMPKLDVAEDGSSVHLPEGARLDLGSVDLTHTGVLDDVVADDAWMLLPSGAFERIPSLDVAQGTSRAFWREGDFAARIPTRFVDGTPYGMQRTLGARTVITEHVTTPSNPNEGGGTPAFQDELFVVADVTDPSARKETTVARIHDCSNLPMDGTFLPRAGGGWYFTSPSGCTVTVDDTFHRLDGWSLVDRLRMRGSMYVDWNEPSHLVEVGWPLFGLPIALIAAYALHRWTRRGRASPQVPFVVAGWVFTATAVLALVRAWPILR